MADYWIVSSHWFKRHATLQSAHEERARLMTVAPEKSFRVMRCKTGEIPGNTSDVLSALRAALESCVSRGTLPPDVAEQASLALELQRKPAWSHYEDAQKAAAA